MNVKLAQGNLEGKIKAHPSKSYAHRYLIGCALSKGGFVKNIEYSDDIIATLNSLEALGFSFIRRFDSIEFLSFKKVSGIPVLDCNESGSTLRFLIPIALTIYNEVKFTGTERLIKRGIEEYEKAFKSEIEFTKDNTSITVKGTLKPKEFHLDGNISSQYISGLLFALPLLDGDSKIVIDKSIESAPYVDITIDVIKRFGIDIALNSQEFIIKGNQTYAKYECIVEGDYSNAAFIDAFNYLGSKVEIEGLNPYSYQGDKKYLEFFKLLSEGFQTIDIKDSIDLGPVLFVFASLNHGARFIGTKRLEIKESNRIKDLEVEMNKIGVTFEIKNDEVTVSKINTIVKEVEFDSHNDHRVLMSLSLYSSIMNVKITNSDCVKKSNPNFFIDLLKLKKGVEFYE